MKTKQALEVRDLVMSLHLLLTPLKLSPVFPSPAIAQYLPPHRSKLNVSGQLIQFHDNLLYTQLYFLYKYLLSVKVVLTRVRNVLHERIE